jgi:hypothetical protein
MSWTKTTVLHVWNGLGRGECKDSSCFVFFRFFLKKKKKKKIIFTKKRIKIKKIGLLLMSDLLISIHISYVLANILHSGYLPGLMMWEHLLRTEAGLYPTRTE